MQLWSEFVPFFKRKIFSNSVFSPLDPSTLSAKKYGGLSPF